MSMDPNRWVNTIPFIGSKSNQEKYKLDSNRWINTLPKKDDNILILSNTINSNPKSSSGKKYSLTMIGFVIGLILVSVIKNETRNLQKAISNLQTSINTLKLDLHKTVLEHEVITSPENISRLAEEYLESDLAPYKKSQIAQLKEMEKTLTVSEKKHQKVVWPRSIIKLSAQVYQMQRIPSNRWHHMHCQRACARAYFHQVQRIPSNPSSSWLRGPFLSMPEHTLV